MSIEQPDISHLSFLVGVSSFSLSFFRSFNRASAFSFSFFSFSFSLSSFSFSFSCRKQRLNFQARCSMVEETGEKHQYLLKEFVSIVLHLFLNTLPVFFGSFPRFQLILELHDLHLGDRLKKKSKKQGLWNAPNGADSKIKYLDFSKFAAFFLVHFRHLGFHIRVVPRGVEVALIVFRSRTSVVVAVVVVPSGGEKDLN